MHAFCAWMHTVGIPYMRAYLHGGADLATFTWSHPNASYEDPQGLLYGQEDTSPLIAIAQGRRGLSTTLDAHPWHTGHRRLHITARRAEFSQGFADGMRALYAVFPYPYAGFDITFDALHAPTFPVIHAYDRDDPKATTLLPFATQADMMAVAHLDNRDWHRTLRRHR